MAAKVTDLSSNALSLYSHYIKGFLPSDGNLLQQNAWLLDAFAIIAVNIEKDD